MSDARTLAFWSRDTPIVVDSPCSRTASPTPGLHTALSKLHGPQKKRSDFYIGSSHPRFLPCSGFDVPAPSPPASDIREFMLYHAGRIDWDGLFHVRPTVGDDDALWCALAKARALLLDTDHKHFDATLADRLIRTARLFGVSKVFSIGPIPVVGAQVLGVSIRRAGGARPRSADVEVANQLVDEICRLPLVRHDGPPEWLITRVLPSGLRAHRYRMSGVSVAGEVTVGSVMVLYADGTETEVLIDDIDKDGQHFRARLPFRVRLDDRPRPYIAVHESVGGERRQALLRLAAEGVLR